MAVLKLMEEGKINLDSNVTHYIPTFPYPGITVKMLLDHRSGLPNYLNFMTMPLNKRGFRIPWDNKQFLTNDSLLSILIRYKPPVSSKPGTRFHYCNTNYAMLALVVERATGLPFPQYIKQTIFDPLGMKDTYIFSPDRAATAMLSYHRYRRGIAPFPWTPLDGVYGDKNVYCTARDLLIWDKALRHDFLAKATLEMAYSPYSFEKPGIRNYGLGWHMFLYPTEKVIFHNGYWHGNNTVFFRLLKEGYTIIVLGNVYNKNIYRVQPLAEALTGRKFGAKGPPEPDQTDQDDPDSGGAQ
jgi:CubicO group peptidase (beta-lactamase class C family)